MQPSLETAVRRLQAQSQTQPQERKFAMHRHLRSVFAVLVAVVSLALSTQVAVTAKDITFNNGSGTGVWNFTDANWTSNPYVDGDTVRFNTATWAGPVTISGNVSPATLIIQGSGWPSGTPSGTPVTFSGGDIVGATTTISVNQDKAGVFTQDNLSFGGGTFLTSNAATIRFNPPSPGTHWFGTGPITLSHNSTTFQFNPGTAGASLGNDFVIAAGITANWQNISATNGGVFAGALTVNAGGGLTLGTGTVSMPTTLKGNTTFNVCANGGGTGFITSQISSDGGPHNLVLQSSGNGDHKAQVSGSSAWNVANVERKVSVAGTWGTVFINNENVLFTQLAGNGGAFIQSSGTTAFGTPTATNLDPTINFPLVFNGGGFFGAGVVNLNLVAGGVLSGSGSVLRTSSFANANFNQTVNVKVNPGGSLAMSGGSIGSATVASTVMANGGAISGANGNATVYGTTTVNSGATTFTMPGTSQYTGAALVRTAGATALFRGDNLGATANVTFSSGTGLTGGIIPWALADASNGGAGSTFATYGAGGFAPLAAYDATNDLSVNGNVDLTAANSIAAGDPDRTVNALRLSSGGGVMIDSARTLNVTSGGILALAGNTGFTGGTLAFGAAEGVLHTVGDLTVASNLTGSGGLTKAGTGTLTLSGSNSLGSGATAVNGGQLTFGASNAVGTGVLTVQPGATVDLAGFSQTVGGISNNAGQAVGGTVTASSGASVITINNTGTQTFSGAVIGSMALVKSGAGTQHLNAANSYDGGTTLAAGTLGVGDDSALGSGGLTLNGGTIQANLGARTLANALTVGGDFTVGGSNALTFASGFQLTGNRQITTSNTGVTTILGDITEDATSRSFTKAGAGTLVLAGNANWTGQTIISGGVLRAAIPNSNLRFNGAAGDSPAWEGSGTFSRNLGTTGSTVQWTGTGGFAANGGPLAIQLNGGTGTVTWNSGNFVPAGHVLVLGLTTADNVVDFQNDINFNGANRSVRVVDNPNSTADYALISGNLNGGANTLIKLGIGTLRLTGNNTLGGIEAGDGSSSNGTIEFDSAAAMGGGILYGNYSTILTLRNISGGPVTLPHELRSRNNNYTVQLAGNDLALDGAITGTGGQATLRAATGTTVTLNGAITGTPTLGTTTGYFGTFILNPGAGTTGRIANLGGSTIGIATDNAFGVTTGAQYTDASSNTTFFAVGGDRTIGSAVRWGGYNGVQTFNGDYNLTFTADQNVNWFNTNNHLYWMVNAPLVTLAGTINEPSCQNIYKQGPGVLALTGTNSFVSNPRIDAGVLRANDGVGLPSGVNLRLNGGVLEGSGSIVRSLGTAGGQVQWLSTGGGGFSAFGGPLTVDINNDGAGASPLVWASTANFVANGRELVFGSFAANNVVTLVDNISFNGAQRTIRVNDNPESSADYAVLSGILSGAGSSGLNKTGAGLLVLSGNNSYTGTTTIAAGILQANHASALGVGGNIVLAGGTLQYSAASAGQDWSARFKNSASAISLDTNGQTVSLAAIDATNSGGLTKLGAGTLVLAGVNAYAGPTTVEAGTLLINGSTGLSSAVVVNGGTLGGSGIALGSITVNSGGTLAAGTSIESLGSGALSFTDGSTFEYELNSSVLAGDLTYVTGTVSLTGEVTLVLDELASGKVSVGSKLTLISSTEAWNGGLFTYQGSLLADDSVFTLGSNKWLFNYNDTVGGSNFAADQLGAINFITMTAIPEPTAGMLLALGGLLALRRRRRA